MTQNTRCGVMFLTCPVLQLMSTWQITKYLMKSRTSELWNSSYRWNWRMHSSSFVITSRIHAETRCVSRKSQVHEGDNCVKIVSSYNSKRFPGRESSPSSSCLRVINRHVPFTILTGCHTLVKMTYRNVANEKIQKRTDIIHSRFRKIQEVKTHLFECARFFLLLKKGYYCSSFNLFLFWLENHSIKNLPH